MTRNAVVSLVAALALVTLPWWPVSEYAITLLVYIGLSSLVAMGLVLLATAVLITGLFLFFRRSINGKALRAAAVCRRGAQLVGISAEGAGRSAFTLAALIAALCGVLIAPLATVYFDSGFLFGLKGFVGAIFGGLVSYPAAAAGALLVGLLESYASFEASAFKEVIVFGLIVPVLLWRSLTSGHGDDE